MGARRLWNPTKMIPLLIRSANVVHSLPDRISSTGDEDREWVEVGVVAKIVLDICQFNALDGKQDSMQVYNTTHPRSFSWEREFLSALKQPGIEFRKVSYRDWVGSLRDTDADLEKNRLVSCSLSGRTKLRPRRMRKGYQV